MILGRRSLFCGARAYGSPVDYYSGTYSGRAAGVNGWTFVDLDMQVPAMRKVSGIWLYDSVAYGYALCIMQRLSSTSFKCLKRLDVTSATSGWQLFSLPAEYMIPSDSYTYFIGLANTGANSPCIISTSRNRAYCNSTLAEGTSATFTVDFGSGITMGYRGRSPL